MCSLNEVLDSKVIDSKKPRMCWRWFDHTGGKLNSVTQSSKLPVWGNKIATADVVPTMENGSGLHVYKTLKDAYEDSEEEFVLAKVKIWGNCVEHANGFRAEHAQIVTIYPSAMNHETVTKTVKRLVTPKPYWVTDCVIVKIPFAPSFHKSMPKLKHVKVAKRLPHRSLIKDFR